MWDTESFVNLTSAYISKYEFIKDENDDKY